jgi:hypothetical protein
VRVGILELAVISMDRWFADAESFGKNPEGAKYFGMDIGGITMHPHQAKPGWKGFSRSKAGR